MAQTTIPHDTIDLFEEVPYTLVAVFKDTGKPIPGAVISNQQYSLDNPIGNVVINPQNPNLIVFKPTGAGDVTILAKAIVTVP
jgi:hypothetical protein